MQMSLEYPDKTQSHYLLLRFCFAFAGMKEY